MSWYESLPNELSVWKPQVGFESVPLPMVSEVFYLIIVALTCTTTFEQFIINE